MQGGFDIVPMRRPAQRRGAVRLLGVDVCAWEINRCTVSRSRLFAAFTRARSVSAARPTVPGLSNAISKPPVTAQTITRMNVF